MYSSQVFDHFEHPRNSGILERADATVQVENPVCGDVLRLMVRISANRIDEIRFLAQGCVPAIACASALTELASGKTVDQAEAIKREELLKKLGGLPETSIHASHLALDALKALLSELRSKPAKANGP